MAFTAMEKQLRRRTQTVLREAASILAAVPDALAFAAAGLLGSYPEGAALLLVAAAMVMLGQAWEKYVRRS